jgi:hypothetical protein
MKLKQILTKPREIIDEANIAAKILKDPKTLKMISIAFRHDHTLPKNVVAKLGPKPTDQQIAAEWGNLIDTTLSSNKYGDLSADGKFDDWLIRLYINGVADYEDIHGEAGDALGAWKALSRRGLLKPSDQDFNKFASIRQLQRIKNDPQYSGELRRIRDSEHIERMKRDSKEIVLVNDKRFLVTLPLNYGSCYMFNNSSGYDATYCTGSSSGSTYFPNYARQGPVISVLDKENANTVNGKWQIHAPSDQIKNGNQQVNSDQKFAELFPGLMKKIVAAMEAKAEEIKDASKDLTPGGYDIPKDVAELKKKNPISWASEAEPEEEEENPADNAPGTWTVRHIPSNRTASLPANSKADLIRKLTTTYPNYPITDYELTRAD